MGYLEDKLVMELVASTGKLVDGEIWVGSISSDAFSTIVAEHKEVFVSCYIDKEYLSKLAKFNNKSEEEVLRGFLPDKAHLQSGDFGEIFSRSFLQEWKDRPSIPAEKWRNRSTNNDTVRGTDLVGFIMQGAEPNENDILVFSEVKTREKGGDKDVVQVAFDDVLKDNTTRLANSLFLLQHALLRDGKEDEARRFGRFSDPYTVSYKKRLIACVIHDAEKWKEEYLQVLPEKHNLDDDLLVIVIRFSDLAKWIDEFYKVVVIENE